ncbi:MAG: Ig-like domain-containing protein [Salinivirgaceae bacterium]
MKNKIGLLSRFFRQGLLVSIIASLLAISVTTQAQLPTAQQIASKMKMGWNLGNTLEATWMPTPGTASQHLIDSVRAAGFNSVRLPCAWYHNSNKTTNIINASYLALVKQNVDYCINNGMYVMINIHWDEGWLENHVTIADSATVNAMQKAYWTQIAEYFKNYDEHLLFACANEPNSQDQPDGRTVMEKYIQTFIKAVRGTGGNNSSRTLIFQGHPDYSTIPTDEIADRLIFEAHSYGYQFALQEKDFLNPWCGGCGDTLYCIYYWGKGNHSATDIKHNPQPPYDEEADIDNFFGNTLKTRFVDKGVPVILGEFGAWKRDNLAYGADRELHDKSIEYYYYYMVKTALENGAIPFCWDVGSLFDRGTGKLNDLVLVNGMVRAVTDTIPATEVTINQVNDSIVIGATTSLTATISPSNATYKTVIWTSDNPSVATVSSAGLVTGHKTGKTTISAMAGVKRAALQIVVGIPVTSVTIDQNIDSLAIGATVSLTATVLPLDAMNKTVTWTSDNTIVATVSSAGLVTGLKVGNATISAMAGDKKATLQIVVGIPVTCFTKTNTIKIMETKQLFAAVLPSNASVKTVSWSSSNITVATVSASGLVTAVSTGTATITATANGGGVTATCKIIVSND